MFEYIRLPKLAKNQFKQDKKRQLQPDCGPDAAIHAGIEWLCRAQDCSKSNDGGVARDYSFITGWATSYPETTGYIIPTFIEYANTFKSDDVLQRAKKMLDWIVSIQFSDGGFQGGKVDAIPKVPVTFNTGQILLGLVAGQIEFGCYSSNVEKAANWLRDSIDEDGCWRKHPTPFAEQGEKTYETHVAWSLFEAAKIYPNNGYGEAGLKQVDWALKNQRDNGWFDKCCLNIPASPLTHTIGYALRGILEAYEHSNDQKYLDACLKTAQPLVKLLSPEGILLGRYDSNWNPVVEWACLTGIVQISYCWLRLYEITNYRPFYEGGLAANKFVRKTIMIGENKDISGGVKGSYPVQGDYGRYELLNWSVKFSIDANMQELRVKGKNQTN